jgi:DNA-binding GntR family transcriptional regulator
MAKIKKLETIPVTSRSDAAAEKLRAAIFEGRYPPGSPLREIRIAKELGVSQATVREGLQKLERAGLVARTPNIGTSVVRLSPNDVRERVELRAELEVKAAKLASARMGKAEYRELARRLAVLTQAVRNDSHYAMQRQRDLDAVAGAVNAAAFCICQPPAAFGFRTLARRGGRA